MNKKVKFYNFPIQLLDRFMIDTTACLENIRDFSITQEGAKTNVIFNVENGKLLTDSIPPNSPRTGINVDLWIEFYNNDKSDFEKACLLAFLGIKSIIGNKVFVKLSNAYLLSRMDGKIKSAKDLSSISPEIRRYSNEYQTKKIRGYLYIHWGISTYAKRTAGFYASSKLDMDKLAFEVEKMKLSEPYQLMKKAQNEARIKAMCKIQNTS